MPTIYHYTVEQTRSISVAANCIADAVAVADSIFNRKEKPENVFGYKTDDVKEVDISAKLEF